MKTNETAKNGSQEVKAWDVHVVECRSGSYSDSGEPVVLMTLAKDPSRRFAFGSCQGSVPPAMKKSSK